MRRYTIRDYAKPKYVVKRRMCNYDWYDTFADESTPIVTSLNNIVFDDDNYIINRYNAFRSIKNVSNSAKYIMLKIRVNCNRKRSLRDLV